MTHVAVERVRMTLRSVIFGMSGILRGPCPHPLGPLRPPDPELSLPASPAQRRADPSEPPVGGKPPNPQFGTTFCVNRRVVAVLAILLGLLPAGPVRAQEGCQYVLGFLLLNQLIPTVMGPCVSNETPSPNGDSLQQTVNGLAVYRAADNWTAFTDGFRTWINGPFGVQQRLNTERFPWEPDAGSPGTAPAPSPSAPPAPAATFNPNAVTLRLDRAWTGLSGPLGLVNAGDGSGRLFVVEKRGTIRVIRNGQVVTNSFFLDIRDRVNASGSEQGLLGLAFHPRYRENGLFFVNY